MALGVHEGEHPHQRRLTRGPGTSAAGRPDRLESAAEPAPDSRPTGRAARAVRTTHPAHSARTVHPRVLRAARLPRLRLLPSHPACRPCAQAARCPSRRHSPHAAPRRAVPCRAAPHRTVPHRTVPHRASHRAAHRAVRCRAVHSAAPPRTVYAVCVAGDRCSAVRGDLACAGAGGRVATRGDAWAVHRGAARGFPMRFASRVVVVRPGQDQSRSSSGVRRRR